MAGTGGVVTVQAVYTFGVKPVKTVAVVILAF
jgi:hypothetical protein